MLRSVLGGGMDGPGDDALYLFHGRCCLKLVLDGIHCIK